MAILIIKQGLLLGERRRMCGLEIEHGLIYRELWL